MIEAPLLSVAKKDLPRVFLCIKRQTETIVVIKPIAQHISVRIAERMRTPFVLDTIAMLLFQHSPKAYGPTEPALLQNPRPAIRRNPGPTYRRNEGSQHFRCLQIHPIDGL